MNPVTAVILSWVGRRGPTPFSAKDLIPLNDAARKRTPDEILRPAASE